jgi:hypothetical protein
MTEYVIKEVSQSLWMVFADRRSICACADENEALRLMAEHSAANNCRSRKSAYDIAPNKKPAGREPSGAPLSSSGCTQR